MRKFEYPFSIRDAYSIKINDKPENQKLKIAILGGSTTSNLIAFLKKFLLDIDVSAEFYECEYGRFYETAMYDDTELKAFSPQIVYIHTTNRNDNLTFEQYREMWVKLHDDLNCQIIQNNFEMPFYRLLGNRDCYDLNGKISRLNTLNERLYDFARRYEYFHINDINWLSANIGLEKWINLNEWYTSGCAISSSAIHQVCFNIVNIIKSILGKNKKAIAIDLDNTLWDGIAGEGEINLSDDNPNGRAFLEFQQYIKSLRKLGIPLCIISKNDRHIALEALKHGVLHDNDFVYIAANWKDKATNLEEISKEIGIAPTDFVFIDDNPAEQHIIRERFKTDVPHLGDISSRIRMLDRNGYFEPTKITNDDLLRNASYNANIERAVSQSTFSNYTDYLKDLTMVAEIAPLEESTLSRSEQLINKTNQFNINASRISNLTTHTFDIALTAKLKDRFGDNGLVSFIGASTIDGITITIDCWVMSCRVLKRNLEFALFDKFVETAKSQGYLRIVGFTRETGRNKSNINIYKELGFTLNRENLWELEIDDYIPKNEVIAC